MTYNQAYQDWRYLWDIDCALDMSGGYVDQEDLDKLLKSPTKETAADCLCRQIEYWFQVGTETKGSSKYWMDNEPQVREIAERHNITYFGFRD